MALSTIEWKASSVICYTFLSFAVRFKAKANSSITPTLGCGNKIIFITNYIQLVYARVYRIPTFVDSKYIILRANIRFGESSANSCTNFGIIDDFSMFSLAVLSNVRL